MNFLLAIVLYIFIGLSSNVSIDNVYVTDSTIPNLNDNDKIIAIDGHFVNNYDKLALEITIVGEKDFVITVKDKNGIKKNINVTPLAIGSSNLPYEKEYGFEVDNLKVTKSNLDTILADDTIVSVNNETISTYLDLVQKINKVEVGDKIDITVKDKNGIEKSTSITVKAKSDDELAGYSYGYYITGKEAKGILGALKYAFIKFFSTIEQMIFTVLYLITGKISLNMLSGPVGIFNVVSVYSKTGFSNIVSLLCLICVNVGFINLLPLPAFDGGHVLFIIIEKIKGSRVNPKVENTIHNIGFILLMILMVLITYNDIVKLF